MLPIVIIAAVAVPLAIIAGIALFRQRSTAEKLEAEDEATHERDEEEFAEAEAYQDEWRKEHEHDRSRDRLP